MPYVDLGPRIRILGTAHVSQKSVDEVRQHIEEFEPDIVAVELCQARHDALVQERRFVEGHQRWKGTVSIVAIYVEC